VESYPAEAIAAITVALQQSCDPDRSSEGA
jgi:hypothetical protein